MPAPLTFPGLRCLPIGPRRSMRPLTPPRPSILRPTRPRPARVLAVQLPPATTRPHRAHGTGAGTGAGSPEKCKRVRRLAHSPHRFRLGTGRGDLRDSSTSTFVLSNRPQRSLLALRQMQLWYPFLPKFLIHHSPGLPSQLNSSPSEVECHPLRRLGGVGRQATSNQTYQLRHMTTRSLPASSSCARYQVAPRPTALTMHVCHQHAHPLTTPHHPRFLAHLHRRLKCPISTRL